MIFNSVAAGEKSGTRKLTNKWSNESVSAGTTFNGSPLGYLESADIEIGLYVDGLIMGGDAPVKLETESGKSIPYESERVTTTRAVSSRMKITFVMPAENVEIL